MSHSFTLFPLPTPQRAAQGVNKLIIYPSGAQCFPRLACPLYGSVLMHLHDPRKSALGLAGLSVNDPKTIMQIHAPYARMTAKLVIRGKYWLNYRANIVTIRTVYQVRERVAAIAKTAG
ncbi:hypothetical protein [Kosakonia cowanii]|uniref:hypothetical protein n=1 Tax=Kosakonia cowanii TaxID=208223 RepID=UPI00320862D6